MKFLRPSRLLGALVFAAALLLSACSSAPRPYYSNDSFGNDSPYQKHVTDDATPACLAAERTLLGDGYIIEGDSSKGSFKGSKAYRIDGSRSSFLEMNIVCLPDLEGSTIYANGVSSTYDLKKASTSASVGVSVLGSVSLPIGQSVDSMVKVSNETITDRVFYRRFFKSVEKNLVSLRMENQLKAPKLEDLPTPSVSPSSPTPVQPAKPVSDAPVAPVHMSCQEPAPATSSSPPTSAALLESARESTPAATSTPVPAVAPPPVPDASVQASTVADQTPAP